METRALESIGNLAITCSDCAEAMYPNKGKFSPKVGDIAKIAIPGDGDINKEHVWVIVTRVNGDHYEGTMDNDPVFNTLVKYGDKVPFQKSEIEDIFGKGAQ